MDRSPLVTIIVPIYNAEETLVKCLTSIVQQTYQHLQVLLINDGSTDGTKHICRQFAKRDRRITYICQFNRGPAAARNQGLRQASGRFIQFVDADDTIEVQMTEELIKAMTNVDLAICGYTTSEATITPNMTG